MTGIRHRAGTVSACPGPRKALGRYLRALVVTGIGWLALASAAQALPPLLTLQLSRSTVPVGGSSVTAMVTAPLPGQNIIVSSTDPNDGISPMPATDNGDGTYTATITSSRQAGPVTINASNNSMLGGSAQAPLMQTPGPATSISLAIQPPVVAADGGSIATAIATVTDAFGNPVPTDTVGFSSSNPGETVFGTTNNGNGTYSASIRSSFTPGTWTITATDSTFAISTQQPLKEVANTSSTTLITSPTSPASTNQSVTLFAFVNASPGSPHGTIAFYNGFVQIPGCPSSSVTPQKVLATCQTSFRASSSPEHLTAIFTPDISSTVAGSAGTATLAVLPGSTSTSLDASSPSAKVGAPVTYTASVTPSNQGQSTPSGSVQFLNGGKPVGSCNSVPLSASGAGPTATCTLSYSTPGARRLTAIYSGDANFSGSTSITVHTPVQAVGILPSYVVWSFVFAPRTTRVALLQVIGASLGTNVIVTCRGKGCPYARRTTTVQAGPRCTPTAKHKCGPHSAGAIGLANSFHKHRLAVGARVVVQIRRPGWVGKYYSFTIRPAHGPQIRLSCLAPGESKPGIAC